MLTNIKKGINKNIDLLSAHTYLAITINTVDPAFFPTYSTISILYTHIRHKYFNLNNQFIIFNKIFNFKIITYQLGTFLNI